MTATVLLEYRKPRGVPFFLRATKTCLQLLEATRYVTITLVLRNACLVPVVDHLLEPHALVQHPHDDEPLLVAGGQLAVVLVPARHQHRAVVPFQGLVHAQVAGGTRGGRRALGVFPAD